jgi:hypothetical protein
VSEEVRAESAGSARPRRRHPLRGWRQPLLTVVGMAVAVGLVSIVDKNPGALILAGVLAMTLSRNKLVRTWRGRVESVILLPLVALAIAGVGYLLVNIPILGAAIFIAAIFLSIYLRRFGPLWQRVGTLIALPFITLIIVPRAGPGTPAWAAALLSLVALVIVVALRLLAETTRFLPREVPSAGSANSGEPRRPATLRPVASTRMAIQMAVGLVAAVILGVILFPQHVTWVVLTAFLVASGNRGRADVLYKSGLRIAGAAAGSLAAGVLVLDVPPGHPIATGPLFVVLILALLGLGLWLREWSYAAWALVMTLVLTLLQGVVAPPAGALEGVQLWLRVLAIIVGAVCGLAAAWIVLPVRSEPIVRLRIAGALSSLSDFLGEPSDENDSRVTDSLAKLEEIAPAWNAWERITPWRATLRKPGRWMRLTREAAHRARRAEKVSGDARRALGEARRSMRDPDAVGPALLALNDALADSEQN